MKTYFCLLIFSILILQGTGQNLKPVEDYVRINATQDDPLFTTYAAAMTRSRLYGDKAYKMDYYSCCLPVNYSSDHAGTIYSMWKVDQVVVSRMSEYFMKQVVNFSFPDMAIMEYEPFRGIHVKETFFVYSSTIAIVDIEVRNTDKINHEVSVYPILQADNDSMEVMGFDTLHKAYVTQRYESSYRLISSLKTEYGYPTKVRDVFTASPAPYTYGAYFGDLAGFYNTIKTDFYSDKRADTLNQLRQGLCRFIALNYKKRLSPGQTISFRIIRGVQGQDENKEILLKDVDVMKSALLKTFYEDDLILMSKIPRIAFKTRDEKIAYLGAFNLVRGCMYPPAGKTNFNSYAFSRNPLWGWGHVHQVLHESLSMLAYVYMDPQSAQGSQRVYMEQQREDGFIAYRHGPRGLQDYPHKNMPTTSAPFFSYINWEIYKVSKDTKFLEDAYASGCKYTEWLIRNRDTDRDSTFEWGPYGIIENVRDWYNAVFQVSAERYLDVDKEDISDELECLDLTLMVVKEEQSLSHMADVLGKKEECRMWKQRSDAVIRLINKRMWDDSSSFYYSVNRKDHSWHFMTRDLRRQEIIAFLALWADAAPRERAEKLVEALTDTTRFWRRYGVPTLSARDPWFSPYVDYCCKWNGPVWLLWDYLVYEGLRDYGYTEPARELAAKMLNAAVVQLKKNHNFWESFSPDNEVLNCPPNYIWDAIIARVLIEEYQSKQK